MKTPIVLGLMPGAFFCQGLQALRSGRPRFSIPTVCRLRSQIGEVIEQHPVDENIATADFLQERKSGTLVEERDKIERRTVLPPKNQS